eukprot:Lankesteria_metandrocarpae@DN4886_c0_g1_i1.p2
MQRQLGEDQDLSPVAVVVVALSELSLSSDKLHLLSPSKHTTSKASSIRSRRTTQLVKGSADLPISERAFSTLTAPASIVARCKSIVPGWAGLNESELSVWKILIGLTNQLFCVELVSSSSPVSSTAGASSVPTAPENIRKVLFRIYGKDVSELYEPTIEVETFLLLGKKGIAPNAYGCFNGGRIEEWIQGVPLPVDEARELRYTVSVMKILGQFHKINTDDFPKALDKTPFCVRAARGWYDKASCVITRSKMKNSEMNHHFKRFDMEWAAAEVALLGDRICPPNVPENAATRIVFCHNDPQENNIMINRDVLRLIDFEYSAYNYAGFDIASFLLENTIDYGHTEFPFYLIDQSMYPPEESRRIAIAAYLSVVLSTTVTVADTQLLDPILDAVERFTLASHLMWSLWSIIRAPQSPTFEEFDYLHYANARFNAYKSTLRSLQKKGIVP